MQPFVIMFTDITKEVHHMGSQKLKKQVRDAKKRLKGNSRRRRRRVRFAVTVVCTGCIGIFAAVQLLYPAGTKAAYGQEIYQNAGDETKQERGQPKKYKGKKKKMPVFS